jgi:hypothetical protein
MRALTAVACAALLATGCGGDEDPAEDGGETVTEAAGPVAELEPSEPFAVSDIALVSPEGDAVDVPVYVAAAPEERQRGLMFREDLPAGTGMVFLFPAETQGGFWMANTLIPLSIAFFDSDGTVVSVLDMEPCTEAELNDCPTYDPEASYSGALEVNQGFFDEVGLEEGWTVETPQDLPDPTQ